MVCCKNLFSRSMRGFYLATRTGLVFTRDAGPTLSFFLPGLNRNDHDMRFSENQAEIYYFEENTSGEGGGAHLKPTVNKIRSCSL